MCIARFCKVLFSRVYPDLSSTIKPLEQKPVTRTCSLDKQQSYETLIGDLITKLKRVNIRDREVNFKLGIEV